MKLKYQKDITFLAHPI